MGSHEIPFTSDQILIILFRGLGALLPGEGGVSLLADGGAGQVSAVIPPAGYYVRVPSRSSEKQHNIEVVILFSQPFTNNIYHRID